MKTTICDICGRSTRDLSDKGLMISMHHFRCSTVWGTLAGEKPFDICSECMRNIKAMAKRKESDTDA